MNGAQLRSDAAKALFAVLEQGQSLRECLPPLQQSHESRDRAWLQEMVYGSLRQLPILQFWLRPLLHKPLNKQQKIVESLLLVGLYQLGYSRVAPHAAVSETVAACDVLGHGKLKGLVNACLRNAQRQNVFEHAPESEQVRLTLPKWLYRELKQAYPDNYLSISAQMHRQAPLWLRVNQQQITAANYAQTLADQGIPFDTSPLCPDGLILRKACEITQLPGYDEGWFSVQDGAAQQAARLLSPDSSERVLDMCAAPGGKTAHLVESQPSIHCVALDSEAPRLERLRQNFERLHLDAEVVCGDGLAPESWWDGQLFDRILLDAPCSATGVIRRHPDIKWLRKGADITALTKLQEQLLQRAWSILKPGGTLLYATCSLLPQENHQQVSAFLAQQSDAKLSKIQPEETDAHPGWQILPGDQDMDGFYYARLIKC
ncbi:16S rRNA (cytosine(967)-C(5))-methyltransferase [Saliniradius amylolyticus]|uniref:16S rRNA (cytosine(967)-C(5))-methyltransferase n=1 Tax=Saliniradius amylolyticus TaxID=2183582 RepID=A0A2S2DYR8_9ALTE|nr:16S rRNA (cytosine(967)-C(5))-methyltransferase RsmB [Saliniradius amylolyticus]AWL10534.1 16S rRNA (cytosine(967)-C(5))-methyltransferase [Saliniradius amylolyticus]